MSDIFQYIQDHQDFEFIVKVSFIGRFWNITSFQGAIIIRYYISELYNEELFDLLSDKPRREDTMVDIREGTKGWNSAI